MFRYPSRLEEIADSLKTIDVELQNTPELLNQVNSLTATLETTKTQWATRVKAIPAADISSETYDYLIRTIDQSGGVKMDLLYSGTQPFPNYGFGNYDLKGNATFDDFFRFLWYIEMGRQLYKIRTIDLKQAWTKTEETSEPLLLITYQMIVEAYYSSIAELQTSTGERPLRPLEPELNPFYPSILPEIAPNTRGLVEIKRSLLKGVISGKAFIQDQNDKLREVNEGEEIYLGYISKIDPEHGFIEYILNEGGIIDKGILAIRKGEPIK